MLDFHHYVPTKRLTNQVTINGLDRTEVNEQLYPLALGGDQLSVARYRGSKVIRRISTTPSKRLEGLFATVEDWHTQVVLLKVYIRVYS